MAYYNRSIYKLRTQIEFAVNQLLFIYMGFQKLTQAYNGII